jgi:hypothetical protein
VSPSLFTSYDYYNRTLHHPVPPGARDPDCAHACKLLSPARAIEWIYVDGLRQRCHSNPSHCVFCNIMLRYGWNATHAA